jgi:hypothetical protein
MTAAELANAIARAEQIGAGHLVPVLRMVRAGAMEFVIAPRGGLVPMRRLKAAARPVLVLVGDDDASPSGPADWPQAERLVRWCQFAVVHGAGAERGHYTAAASGALVHRRALLIETTTALEPAWLALIRRVRPCLPQLIVRVPEGRPAHPIQGVPPGVVVQ